MEDAIKERLVLQLKDLYNKYRTALMNREYYGRRLGDVRNWNRRFEITIAVGTSLAIASWAVWQNSAGEVAWAIIAGVATLLAVVKPIINFPREIERYSKLFVGHGDVFFDLDQIVNRVMLQGGFNDEAEAAYEEVLKRIRELAADDDPKPKEKLLRDCYEEVNRRIPPESLWLPS